MVIHRDQFGNRVDISWTPSGGESSDGRQFKQDLMGYIDKSGKRYYPDYSSSSTDDSIPSEPIDWPRVGRVLSIVAAFTAVVGAAGFGVYKYDEGVRNTYPALSVRAGPEGNIYIGAGNTEQKARTDTLWQCNESAFRTCSLQAYTPPGAAHCIGALVVHYNNSALQFRSFTEGGPERMGQSLVRAVESCHSATDCRVIDADYACNNNADLARMETTVQQTMANLGWNGP